MTFAIHLTRVVFVRIAMVALLLGALAVALDLIDSASTVLAKDDGGLLRYLSLRTPLILAVVLPVAFITGPVLAFMSLASRSEFTILRASGATTYRLLIMLIPLAAICGGGYYLLTDRAAPKLEAKLLAWLDPEPEHDAGAFWARTTPAVIHAGASSSKGSRLYRLDIYEISPDGRLTARIKALSARYVDRQWRFDEATKLIPGEGAAKSISGETWDTPLTPANVRALSSRTRTIPGKVATRMLAGRWAGNRTSEYYQVRVWRGYTAFIAPFIMFLLAAPAAFGTARGREAGKYAALAVVMGFGYLLFDGMLTALGETGNLPPLLSAFGAAGIFGAIGAWTLISLEE